MEKRETERFLEEVIKDANKYMDRIVKSINEYKGTEAVMAELENVSEFDIEVAEKK